MKGMLRDNLNVLKKALSLSLVVFHILSLSPVRDAIAYSGASDNYRLKSVTVNGLAGKDSASYSLTSETTGEACVGITESASYRIKAGFIHSVGLNPPEFIETISNQNWPKNESLLTAIDLDDYFNPEEDLTYGVSGNVSITVDIDPVTNIVSFSQPDDYCGTETIYFTATDTEGNIVNSNSIILQVLDVNNPPVLDAIEDITGYEGDLISITPNAADSDGDTITYSFTSPFGADGQWQTDFHDGDGGSCTYTITVTASDKDGSTSRDVDIIVYNVNRPPVIDNVEDIVGFEGELIKIEPDVTDEDGEPVEVWYSAPFGTSGTWLPDYDDSGTYTITINATDGIDTVTESADVFISNVNRSPSIELCLSSYTLNPDEECTIILEASDPDSDSMSFVIKADGEEVTSGDIEDVYTVSVSFNGIGDHTIEVAVTDDGTPEALSVTETAVANVIDPNADKDAITPLIGDFNGDCLTDIGYHDVNAGIWEIALSNNGAFTNTTCWLTGFGTSRDWVPISGDFDGDAITDVGIYNNTNNSTDGGKCEIALSTGSSFEISGQWLQFTEPSYDWQPFTGDFNIDKYTDFGIYNKDTGEARIAFSNGSGFGDFRTWVTGFGGDKRSLYTGDFNGDGLPDICTFKKSTGEWCVAFNNTEGFVDSAVWIDSFAKDKDPLVADFNNDGLTDIGYWDKDTDTWYYAVSTGDKFADKGIWYTDFGGDAYDYAYAGDFDGDSITNPALFDKDEDGIEKWTTDTSAGDFSDDPAKPDLLVGIYNGTGGATHITYEEAESSSQLFLPFPVYVAKEVRLVDMLPADTDNEVYLQRFSYENGYFDSDEREFRGFGKVTVIDDASGNYTQTCFYQGVDGQEAALKGKIEKVIAYDANGRMISQVLNTWAVEKSGPSENVLGFPYLEKVNTTVWENGISLETESEFTYDNIGNVTKTVNRGDVNAADDTKMAETLFASAYTQGHNRPLKTVLKDANGNIVTKKTFEYDYNGNLTKEVALLDTDPGNSPAVYYSYDTYGNLISTKNANGNSLYTSYESTYNIFPETITNELGHTISYKYNIIFGAVEEVTDTNGHKTISVYDSYGRIAQLKNPDNEVVTSYSYPDFNTKVTSQLNLITTEYVDGIGRVYKTVTSGDDNGIRRDIVKEVFYNERGLTDYEVLPYYSGDTPKAFIRYEYDLRGRAISTTADYEGSGLDAVSFTNYISPLEAETVNAEGQRKLTRKDVYGNVVEVAEYNGSVGIYHTHYNYDIQGNLKEVTDTQGNNTYINYDSLGRKTDMTDPDMGYWEYTYDKMGNLISQTDAKGQTINFEYDGLSRLTHKWGLSPGGTVPICLASYEYDNPSMSNSTGRLSRVTDKNGYTTTYNYDKEGRITCSTATINSVSYATSTTYDILGRVQSITYPDAETVNYTYNSNSGQLETVRGLSSTGTVPYISGITYNAMGQIESLSYGNGTSTDYTYHNDFKLQNITTTPSGSSAPIQDLNYTFDKVGNVTTISDNINSNIRDFSYDDLNRLIQANNVPNGYGGHKDITYQYDSIGNMTYKSDLGMFTYGSAVRPHAVVSAGGSSYTYDANGNQTYGRGRSMSYDIENHLISVNTPSGDVDFEYDANGSRVKKIEGDDTTTYISASYEIRNIDGVEKIVKNIFTGSDHSITIEKLNGQRHVYYHHNDHLGSTSLITDENGYFVQDCEYTPFGQVASNSGTYNSPYKFTGKELDANTELYYYGARYYDPVLCHFTQADTIVPKPLNPQTLNRYSYCYNNPLKYVDPSGHFGFLAVLIGAIIGAIVGGVSAAQAGGDIAKGIIFGAIMGAITSVVSQAVGAAMNNLALGSTIGKAFASGAVGAVNGFGAGLITGYVGGAGSSSSMFKSAGIGAGIGFGVAFGMSLASSAVEAANQASTANNSTLDSQAKQRVQEAVDDTNVQQAIDSGRESGTSASDGISAAAAEAAEQASQPVAPLKTHISGVETIVDTFGQPHGNFVSKAFDWLSKIAEASNAPKIFTGGLKSASIFFSDMGPFETAGMALCPCIGQEIGKSIDTALSIDWKWVEPAY